MESRGATSCLSVDTARPATHHSAGAFLCALPAGLYSGKLQANNWKVASLCYLSLSLSLPADHQVYGLHCGAGQNNTINGCANTYASDCHFALCTYPKSMQHFVARKTLKLLKCRVPSAPPLSVLHNISEKELENLNVEFHFGAASGRDVKRKRGMAHKASESVD